MTNLRQTKSSARTNTSGAEGDIVKPAETGSIAVDPVSALPEGAKPPAVASKAAPARKRAAAKKIEPASTTPGAAISLPAKIVRTKKAKLVEVRVEMLSSEALALSAAKKSCKDAGFAVKKAQLLRIGVALLALQDPDMLRVAMDALAPLRVKRSKHGK